MSFGTVPRIYMIYHAHKRHSCVCVHTRRSLAVADGHTGTLTALASHPADPDAYVSAGGTENTHTLVVWSCSAVRCVRKLVLGAPILAVAYETTRGDRLAVAYGGSRTGTLALLDAATLQVGLISSSITQQSQGHRTCNQSCVWY